jgi:uncharacterized protein (DUF2225 family)
MASVFYEQEKKCPVCDTKFKVTRVRSSACFVTERDTDFFIRYRDVNPVHYSIWVCPNCNYASTEKNFPEPLRPVEMERLKKGLPLLKQEEPDFSSERSLQVALRATELAIRTAQLRQSGFGFMASLFLRAAWVSREMGNAALEKEYLRKALDLYKSSYEKEGFGPTRLSDVRLMYLIGELNRRLGQYEEAIQWFSRVVMHKDIHKEPEIQRTARMQWEQAKEEFKTAPKTGDSSPAPALTVPAAADNTPPANDNKAAPVPVSQVSRHRPKSKMFASLYNDQIEWLKHLSNTCHEREKVLLERETILRAVVDAVMSRFPEIDGFSTEEELKQKLLEMMS